MPVVDADGAAELARRGVLLDARAGARYRGEIEPVDARAGHVPGARNAPATEHLGADGRWLPPDALAARYAALGVAGPDGGRPNRAEPGATDRPGRRATSARTAAPGSTPPPSSSPWSTRASARPRARRAVRRARGRSGRPTRAAPSRPAARRDGAGGRRGVGTFDGSPTGARSPRFLAMSPRAAVVWTPEFLTYRLSPDHPLNPVRLDLTIRLAGELGVLDGVDLLEPEPAPDAELHRVHVPSYLEAVRLAPVKGDDPAHGLGTDDNPIFEGMHEASCLVCGGSLLAAREIAEGRADRAVNIAGGLHHAMRDHASGFCVYNDCAVAISWLLDHGFERIAYVDVDVHHGDGVQAAFYDDPRVLTISLHQHPLTLWPGHRVAGRVRRGRGRGVRGERGAAARHRGRGLAARLPRGGAVAARGVPAAGAGHPVRRRHPRAKTRWPTCGCPSTATGRSTGSCASSPSARPAASGSPSAGAGTACSGWSRGRGRTCSRRCSTATSTRRRRCRPGGSATPPRLTGRPLPTEMSDGVDVAHEPWTEGGGPGRRRGASTPGGRCSRCTAWTRDDPRD